MKFKPSNIIWGLGFIIVGVLLYCKAFMGWDISLWSLVWRFWPLLIILPSISGMLTKGFNMSSLVWLIIGAGCLLITNDWVSGSLIRKLVVPITLVLIGIGIIFKDAFSKNKKHSNSNTDWSNWNPNQNTNTSSNQNNGFAYQQTSNDNTFDGQQSDTSANQNNANFRSDSTSQKKPEYNAVFSSTEVKYPNELFSGTCINSVFGSVVLDLRDAIITEDVVINATVIFAGADIYVPGNVNIKVSSVPIFGGVSNKAQTYNGGGPTVYINATCMFGGLDIK